MMDLSHLFGLMAGFAALITYGLYFWQTLRGKSTPNPATWLIWMFVGIINAITYFYITGNMWQSFIVIAAACSATIVFIYSLFKGKFSKISGVEILCFVLAVGVGIFWQISSNDRIANLLLQGIYIISYVPTILGIARGTAKESPTSWIVAFVAYSFSAISIALDPGADWVAFANPLVNGLLGNGSVLCLIIYKRFKQRRRHNS